MSWIKAASLSALDDGPVVVRQPPRQIAVFKVGDAVFAVDNRCPHEGYPLAQGSISADCVLTCHWHNWKFRLQDGECILGGDHVRSYGVRIEADDVYVDSSPPPKDQVEASIMRGLRAAFDVRDFGRICREAARLDFEGIPPVNAVRGALEWAHDRLEFGSTHAMAAMTDWLGLPEHWPGDRESRVVCLSEAIDHLAFDSLRHPSYPFAPAGDRFDPAAFAEAIELEQADRAEGMVRRALDDGLHWADLEESFVAAALAHYNAFGHSLIYTFKARQAIPRLGPQSERFLMLPLTRHIVYATREDQIPEFGIYAEALSRLPEPGGEGGMRPEVPFTATLDEAVRWLERSLASFPVEQVYDALLEALAHSLLHVDIRFDQSSSGPVSQNIGWLDFTHGVTFSNAVRSMCAVYPAFWRQGLLQMACFLGRNHSFIDRDLDVSSWRRADQAAFLAQAREHLLDHGLREPIFAAHHLKNTVAVEDELRTASESCRQALVDSLNRFLHSPIKMKHVRRNVRQAIALVGRDYAAEAPRAAAL
jgi:nitrite reductase/ring-hydroxylating ferredoxin subunit